MSNNAVSRPLWIQITCYGFAAVLFASATIGGIAWYRQKVANETVIASKAAYDLAVIRTELSAVQRSAAALASSMAADPDSVRLIAEGRRPELLSKYGPGYPAIVEEGGLQTVTIVDASGSVIARLRTPDRFGDNITSRRKTIAGALQSGKLTTGIERGSTDINMYTSVPVTRDGVVVGVVDVGTQLSGAFFSPLAERLSAEIAVEVYDDSGFQTQSSTNDGKPLLSQELLKEAVEGKPVAHELDIGDRRLVITAVPFQGTAGDALGVFEIGTDVTALAEEARRSTIITLVVSAAISLLSLVGFLLFARSLAGAVSRLTSTMSDLAAGDLRASVEGAGRRDEIGAMAAAVQVFKDNAIKAGELRKHAETQQGMIEAERLRTEEQDTERAQAMAQATSGLAEGLKHLAEGDLTFRLDRPFAPDFEALRSDFNSAVAQLSGTLNAVSSAASSIDAGAREVSGSADDLSKRTEQQAASLEETVAALHQITANVTNSSKRTEEARSAAVSANDSARQSGVIVSEAVEAMDKIERSSRQISTIIGVIEDIAFQTNLLALNAGVEAARAGEAGKGFAVVAQEVRELAQRSATAAKEIKDLIRNSSAEVESGVALVSRAGEALRVIDKQIVAINQHMDAIATSAREQSVGLSEVNVAVNQMDQVTQRNAAMVEEANAAGATLSMEARRLRELIDQFKLAAVCAPKKEPDQEVSLEGGARDQASRSGKVVRIITAGQR